MAIDTTLPTADELLSAYRTLLRLRSSIPFEVRGPDGESVWEGVVQGRRYLAIATSWLGNEEPAYADAWEKMIGVE